MGIFKTPKQPDPIAMSQAQAGANRDGAISSQMINMVDQNGPSGESLRYTRTGEDSFVDSTGKTVTQPRFLATTTLNPTQMAALNQEQTLDLNTNTLANRVVGNASGALSSPFDYSEDAIKSRTDAMINPRLADRFGKDEAALRTQLVNRGVREGSEAFNDAMLSFNQGRTDAYSSEALSNRQQAIQELGLGRDRAINEATALGGMQQIAPTQFVSTPRANVDAAPIAQLISHNAANRASSHNAMLGGLFGLGGSLIGAGSKAFFPGKPGKVA